MDGFSGYGELGEAFFAVEVLEGGDEVGEVAGDDFFEGEVFVEAMVGAAVLGEVVGADAGVAVAAADHGAVGVNRYILDDEEPIEILKIDPALEQKQIDRLAAVRAGRDSATVEARLATLKESAAKSDVNLMQPIIEASRDYVTLGEMCDALRDVWGVWRETPVF